MAANFNKPDLSSLEVDAVDEYKERDVDIAKMFDGTSSTNIPTNAIKFDVTSGVLQRREGGAWVTKALDIIDATTGTLSVSRGGTGATTSSAARTNLSVPPTSLTISAGTGLNGGGSLSANRTLSVDVGTDSNQIPRNSDLGSAATTDATAYATSAQGDTADSALQSSDAGTASTKDVGTGPTNVPQNSDLGSASTKDVGTDPTNVPQNSDLGSAATTDATAYATAAQGDTADAALKPANNLSDVASASASRTNLGVAGYTDTGPITLDGEFTAGTIYCAKVGNVVTLTSGPPFGITSDSLTRPKSNAVIPPDYRPSVLLMNLVVYYYPPTDAVIRILIDTDGTIQFRTATTGERPLLPKTSWPSFCLSYIVTGDV